MWERQPLRVTRLQLIELLCENEVPECKERIDPRVTSRFAVFCRRYSLDELPQLWQICCGEMSFVGPRPLTAAELAKYYGENTHDVLKLKPGLSGLWQVLGRNRLTYRQRRRLDLWLVRNFSPSLYFAILMRTPPQVLSGRNAT
jgi:lipopolysaccharide/colanic/teichoic acid biosynthesis glycosyltransferase